MTISEKVKELAEKIFDTEVTLNKEGFIYVTKGNDGFASLKLELLNKFDKELRSIGVGYSISTIFWEEDEVLSLCIKKEGDRFFENGWE